MSSILQLNITQLANEELIFSFPDVTYMRMKPLHTFRHPGKSFIVIYVSINSIDPLSMLDFLHSGASGKSIVSNQFYCDSFSDSFLVFLICFQLKSDESIFLNFGFLSLGMAYFQDDFMLVLNQLSHSKKYIMKDNMQLVQHKSI